MTRPRESRPSARGQLRTLATLTRRRLPSSSHTLLCLALALALPSSFLSSSIKQYGCEAGFKARLAPPCCDSAPGLSRGWVAGIDFKLAAFLGPQDAFAPARSTPGPLVPSRFQPIATSSSLSPEWVRLALKLASPSLTVTQTRGYPADELWTTAHRAATCISSSGQ